MTKKATAAPSPDAAPILHRALLDAEQALRNVQRQNPADLDAVAKGLAAAWRALPAPMVAALEQLDLTVIAMVEAPSPLSV